MQNRAIFLDRDGTINFDPGYLGDANLVKIYPNVAESLKLLKNNFNFKLIVISNQSGIARKLITEKQVEEVNLKINYLINQISDIEIDKFYFCPHHPMFDTLCNCRKPAIDLVLKAQNDFNIDLSQSYFIGDKISDIECGNNAGIKTVLIDYNNKKDEMLTKLKKMPNFVASDFLEVYEFIKNDILCREE